MLLGAGYAEVIPCSAILFVRKDVVRVSLLVWVSTMFMLYRFGSYLLGSTEACSCAGHTIGQMVPNYALLGVHLVRFKRTRNPSCSPVLRKSPKAGKV